MVTDRRRSEAEEELGTKHASISLLYYTFVLCFSEWPAFSFHCFTRFPPVRRLTIYPLYMFTSNDYDEWAFPVYPRKLFTSFKATSLEDDFVTKKNQCLEVGHELDRKGTSASTVSLVPRLGYAMDSARRLIQVHLYNMMNTVTSVQ